jgi:phosphatidylserine/phosphatidylglycerophosphate/cardiolipin synthase-like enzyme
MISWDCVYSSDDDEISSTRFLTTRVEHVAFLKDAFGKAQQYITIVSPYISSYAIKADGLEKAILEAQFRGVTVTVYTDKKLDVAPGGDIKENAERGRDILRSLLCDLHIVDKVHAKTLIVDGTLIATGSFNWLSAVRSDNSAYANLEHTLVIDSPDLAAEFTKSAMKSITALQEEVDHPYRGFYEGFNIGGFFASSSDAEYLAWWITVNQGKGLFSFDDQRELTDYDN